MKHVVSARNQQCFERMSNDQSEKRPHSIPWLPRKTVAFNRSHVTLLTGNFVDAWNPVDYSIQIKELFGNSWGKPLGYPFLEDRKTLGPFPSDAHWRTQQPLPVSTWVVSNGLMCRLQNSISSKVRDSTFFVEAFLPGVWEIRFVHTSRVSVPLFSVLQTFKSLS